MKTILQWLIFALMTVWFGLSLCFLAGDDDPNKPMPLLLWFIIKAVALGSLYLSGKVYIYLHDNGHLPKCLTVSDEELDKM